MRRTHVPRGLLTLAALLLCLAPSVSGQEASNPSEAARQLAAEADDNAVSLEDRQESLRKLEEAARLSLGVNDTTEAARALNRAGRLQLILNSPQDSLASHSKALDLLKETPDAEAEADALNGMGAARVRLDEGDEAKKVLERSLLLSEQSGYTAGQAQALLTLSEEQNPYDHARALETARKSLALWQTLDDKRGIARALTQVGQYYMAQNLLFESAQNYQLALNIWRDLNNPAEQAGVLIMLGFIEFRRGEWAACISFLTQAEGMLDERAEPRSIGQIASTLAEAFSENGMPENSLTQYDRALEYFKKTNDPHLIAVTTWGIGRTYYRLGNYPEAVARFEQVLAGLHNDSLQAQCYEYLGRVYLATGEYELALKNLNSALDIYTRAANPWEAAQVTGLLGQLAERQGRFGRARQFYKQALADFDKFSDRINQAAVYFALGRMELRSGGSDAAARDYLRQSIEMTESLRRVPTSSDLSAAFSATVHDRYEYYVESLMREHRESPSRGLDARAFEVSESGRGRSLVELLRATATNAMPGLDPKLAEEEKRLRLSLRVKDDYKIRLLAGKYKKEELDALTADLARLEAEYKRVTEVIRASQPYEQATSPTTLSLRQIQELVVRDDQTVLVEYSLGADKSYVWAVTRDGVTSHELPARESINDAALKVYNLLSTPPGQGDAGEFDSAARELTRTILSPVADALNKHRRVIVVADGALNYIPFQVLPEPSAGDEPLIQDHEVVNAPSASILGGLRQEAVRREPAGKVLAAFGDPVFASDYARRVDANGAPVLAMNTIEAARWRSALRDVGLNGSAFNPAVLGPLFYAKRELTNLREASGSDVFVAEGFDATRERLLSADLTQYAILHFATHGLLDPKHPEFSGLVLSTVGRDGNEQNGFVSLQDIYSIRAPVDLVVLSACQTALGKDVRGEGLLGLARGFMYAGASGVVASLWKVEDKATAELMKQFYTNMLRKGMPPGAALRAAQNTIRQNPRWRSPYYWAAFTLQGEYGQPIRHKQNAGGSSLKMIAAGACLLTLLAFAFAAWWYRRRGTRGVV